MLLVTNANHSSVVRLYEGLGECNVLDRHSVVSGSSDFRGRYSELAITIGYKRGRSRLEREQDAATSVFGKIDEPVFMRRSLIMPSETMP